MTKKWVSIAPLSGTSLHSWGIVNTPTQNIHTKEPNTSNCDLFVIPTSNNSHANVSDSGSQYNKPNTYYKKNITPLKSGICSTNTGCAQNSPTQSESLGNDNFELLLQTLKAHLDVQPGQESLVQNLSTLNDPAKKHAATVYLLANISQKMDCVLEAISGSQNNVNFDSLSIESYTKGTDSESQVIGKSLFSLAMNNLQNRPKEWKIKYLPISFCKEENEAHSIILRNILVQDKNPEQPIPRLIELTKFLLEWAAPKGTSYSNKEVKDRFKDIKIQHYQNIYYGFIFEIDRYIAKKMVSEIDISVVELPTEDQVEQKLMENSEALQDDYTSDEQ
ncbi:hypothetical protein BY996DRAFT_6418959 [Phakopsora pachyrhizi]|nr:hypothetical protein BY996DRAFT_6418959 [Phakopsora pachyrhizi]